MKKKNVMTVSALACLLSAGMLMNAWAASFATYGGSYGPGGWGLEEDFSSYYDDYESERDRFNDYDFGEDYEDGDKWDDEDGDDEDDDSRSSKYAEAYIDSVWWEYDDGRCIVRWSADYASVTTFTVTIYHGSVELDSRSSRGGTKADVTSVIAENDEPGRYYARVSGEWPDGSDMYQMSEDFFVESSMLSAIRSRGRSSSFSVDGEYDTDFDNAFDEEFGYSTSGYVSGGPGASSGSGSGPAVSGSSYGNYSAVSGSPGSGAAGPMSSGINAGGSYGTGWRSVGSNWKYVRGDGQYAISRWELINGKWYYFDQAANMAKSAWIQTDGKWYYLNSDGAMAVNQWIISKTNSHIWYYVGADGAMAVNTVVNGWVINAAGECYY